ncbi:MAG: hypothetical protein FWG90_03580 [Oscillospiraceae bacterium]|nr:hypothetical protein [Oscillospiraceae bacterium]
MELNQNNMPEPQIVHVEETETHIITHYIHGELKYSKGAKVITKVPKFVPPEVEQNAVNKLYEFAADFYGVDVRRLRIIP